MKNDSQATITSATKIINAASIAAIVFSIVYLGMNWGAIPDRIAIHFRANGNPDHWGSKNALVIQLILTIVFYVIFSSIAYFKMKYGRIPQIIDQIVYEKQNRLMGLVFACIKMDFTWIMAIVEWHVVQIALGKAQNFNILFVLIPIFATSILIGAIMVFALMAGTKSRPRVE